MNREELINALSDLNGPDLGLLISGLENKWGMKAVKQAAPVEVITKPVEEVEEQTEFDVIIESFPAAKKISVIKVIRECVGLSLTESKEAIEHLPKVIRSQISKEEADVLAGKLKEAEAVVILK